MSISKLTYKDYSFAQHQLVYQTLEEVFTRFAVKYYLIGANARDIALYQAKLKPNRGTADIDFAVMLPDIETYNELKNALVTRGFEIAYGGEPYRLYYPVSNTVIDLLPYGNIAQNNTVQFNERNIELSVVGMIEVGEHAQNFTHPEGCVIPVTPAHGIVILKLISWSEKPDRTKDLHDIKALLDAAWELYEDEIYQEKSPYLPFLNDVDFEMHLLAARVMGCKMQLILQTNAALHNQIVTTLQNELTQKVGPIATQLVVGSKQTVQEIQKIFNALLLGINDIQ